MFYKIEAQALRENPRGILSAQVKQQDKYSTPYTYAILKSFAQDLRGYKAFSVAFTRCKKDGTKASGAIKHSVTCHMLEDGTWYVNGADLVACSYGQYVMGHAMAENLRSILS